MDTTPKGDNSRKDAGEWIYARRVWHWRGRRYIYPKRGQVFRFRRKRR